MAHSSMGARMPLDEDEQRRLINRLVGQLRCVECGRLYPSEDFVLVHRWQDVWVLSTRCRRCEEPCHVVVFMHLAAEPEPVVDLTPEEAEVAGEWPPITGDDVLDVHVLLREFDGDLKALLNA